MSGVKRGRAEWVIEVEDVEGLRKMGWMGLELSIAQAILMFTALKDTP